MPPRAFNRSTANVRKRSDVAPRHCGSLGGKMCADIAVGERAEDGVDQQRAAPRRHPNVRRARGHVRCGPAQHDMIAVAKGVHVEAHAGADVGKLFKQHRFGSQEIVGGGKFDVGCFALESRDWQSRPFRKRGVVGEIQSALCLRALMRLDQGPEPKTCGVCTMRRVVRSTVRRTRPSASTSFTVSVIGKAGMAAPVALAATKPRVSKALEAKGRAASWMSTQFGPGNRERLQPRQHGGLPGCPTEHRFRQFKSPRCRFEELSVVRVNDDLYRPDFATFGEQRETPSERRKTS